MIKSLKDNFLQLSKKFGKPYSLESKGIKKGIIQSILKGSIPKISEAYEVAKVLGVSMEELLTGKFEERKIYSPEQQKYINKLIDILNGNDDHKKITITTMLDNLKRDTWEKESKKSTHHDQHIKKQKAG